MMEALQIANDIKEVVSLFLTEDDLLEVILTDDWSVEQIENDKRYWSIQPISSMRENYDRSSIIERYAYVLRCFSSEEQFSKVVETLDSIETHLLQTKIIRNNDGRLTVFDKYVYNSPIKMNNGDGVEGFYDAILLEKESLLSTSALIYVHRIKGA